MKTATIISFDKARAAAQHKANPSQTYQALTGMPLTPDQIWQFLDQNVKLNTQKSGR